MWGGHPESEQTETKESGYEIRGDVGFDGLECLGIRGTGECGKLRNRKMLRQRMIFIGGRAKEDGAAVSQLNCNRASSELNQPHRLSDVGYFYFALLHSTTPAPQPGVYGEQFGQLLA